MHVLVPSAYSTRKWRGWQEAAASGLVLALLAVVYFWPQVVGGRVLYWGDIGLYFLPMTTLLHGQLLTGHIPLWNPWVMCGTPYVGNPQTWPLYPASMGLAWLSAGQFINLTVAAHTWLAAWGTWLFLRRAEGLSGRASLLGGVVFGLGGQIVSKEQFPNMVQAIAWMPLILYASHRLALRWRVPDALLLGLLVGLQILAAHAQMTLLSLYAALGYGTFVWARGAVRPRWGVVAERLGVAGLVAAGLSAGQTLPTVELYTSAWRQRLPFGAVDRFTLPLNQLGNFALPTLHGSSWAGDFVARGNEWETCCFLSVVGVLLAAAGGISAWRGGRAVMRFWLGWAVLGVWMALGGKGGLYHVAYAVLPGFRSFHDPARCLLWSAWGGSVLAAYGWQCIEKHVPRRARMAAFGACLILVFADLAHFGRTLYPLAAPQSIAAPMVFAPSDAAVLASGQGRVLAPDVPRTWQRFTTYRSFRQSEPSYLPLWAQTYTPNLGMLFRAYQAGGYEPLPRRDAQVAVKQMTEALRPPSPLPLQEEGMREAGRLGVRTVVFLRVQPPGGAVPGAVQTAALPTLPLLGSNREAAAHVYVCRNLYWQPRARLTTQFAPASTQFIETGTTTIMGNAGFAPRREAHSVPAQIVLDTPDRVTVQADTAAPALLVLADTLHPGWQATVDGRAVPLLQADGFLRAVALPRAGLHRVEFTYRPTSFLLGYYLTLLTLGALLASACWFRAQRSGE